MRIHRALWAAVVIGLVANHAAAHPLVDRGRDLMRRARFDEALQTFAEAENAADLTRDDVIDLLDARCMVHLATADADSLEQDLLALASLDPNHRFGEEAPPELQDAFGKAVEDVGGPLEVTVEAQPNLGGLRLQVHVERDPANLVRETRLFVRLLRQSWRLVTSDFVPVAKDQEVAYYAEAVGPGSAILATHGTRGDPAFVRAGARPPLRNTKDDEFPWMWVGVGGGALVGLGVIVLLLVSGESDETQPTSPLVVGF